jgi:hypothetical protein
MGSWYIRVVTFASCMDQLCHVVRVVSYFVTACPDNAEHCVHAADARSGCTSSGPVAWW